ncbi:hypothetical protein RB653_010310 [Dictyostelium firmibasis]|uniref:AAA+ ATPase domain-containing protein n=1 Tax=Dictyostelium firmibasis TaxID=79012 RepID=A0AAN7TZ42_9MYCE
MLGTKRNLNETDDRFNDENVDSNNNNNNNNNSNGSKRFKTNLISFEKKSNTATTSITSTTSTPVIPLGSQKRINITSFSGHRITRVIKSQNTENISTSLSKSNILFNDLLKKPINEILEEIENTESLKLKSELIKNSNSLTPTKSKGVEELAKNKDNRLWVDKYAPSSFHDLLSDTTMNLEVLNWLELWDHIVFGKPLPKNLVMPSTFGNNGNNNNNSGTGGYINRFNSKFTTSSNSNQQHQNQGQYLLQEDGTPIAKIILLTGGPGLGKTTLAHVLAKQANYTPVEINASEDRSGEAFESKLLSAIEMKSLFNDKKPNCLIIDEIDGISGRDNGPIELLIKLIDNSLKIGNTKKSTGGSTGAKKSGGKDGESSDNEEEDDEYDEEEEQSENGSSTTKTTKGKKGKKKGFTTRLLRPIICICNDQYVPSLRKLRQKAMVFDFQAPKKHELLSRLKVICSNEGLTASDATLNSLIDMTGSDIRACINSLQFIKSKTSVLNSDILKNKSNIVIGQKDMEKGLVEIWNNIFKTSTVNNKNNNNSNSNNNNNNSSVLSKIPSKKSNESSGGNEYLNQLDFQIGACNQVDKLLDGVYENFLTNMSSDYTMEKTMDCLDWMVFGDQMLNIHADEKYRSLVPLAVHQRCTTYSPKIQLPHSDYDNFIKKKSNTNIKDSFYSDLPATIYSYLTKKCFVIDFIYPFIDILSLPVRVTNVQLYSQTEKFNLNRLIEIMKFYRLSYKLEKVNNFNKQLPQKKLIDVLDGDDEESRHKKLNQQTQDVAMQYKLEPPIDSLLYFQNQDPKTMVKHIRLSHSQKQIISIAVQQYKPPQKSTQPTVTNTDENQKQKEQSKKPTIITSKEEFKKPLVPTVLKDFFGRVIQTSPETKKKTMGPTPGPNIKYRFQEGFTNAVKKTVYVKDFL